MTEETRSQCFRCDQESYWSQVVWTPLGHQAMSKVTSRRTLDCRLTPCPSRCRDIILRSANLSRLSIDDWRAQTPLAQQLSSLTEKQSLQYRSDPSLSSWTLGPLTWSWRSSTSPHYHIVGEGQHTYQPHQTLPLNCILGVLLALIRFWWY